MDSSFWARLPLSGSNISALKGALLFMNLMTPDERPTPELEKLVQAEGAERQTLIKKIFVRSYEDILNQVDLSRATHGQLREYFKSVGADGQMGQKCSTFFLSLAKESGEKLHASLQTKVTRSRGARKGTKRAPIKDTSGKEIQPPAKHEPQILLQTDPSMVGLLQKLPLMGTPWSKEERTNWKKAFDALFEFLYPVKEQD
jgi:hypothetical protein